MTCGQTHFVAEPACKTTTIQASTPSVPFSFVSLVANGPYRAALEECCTATKRATAPLLVAASAADRRNGPGREYAPFLTETEECHCRCVGARDELYSPDPGPPHTPAGALQPLCRRARRVRGRTGLLLCPGRRSGICGAPCSRLSMQSLRCRFSTILLRRW